MLCGNYENESYIINDALILHQKYRDIQIDTLRKAIDKGWDSADITRSIKDIIIAESGR